MKLIFNSIPLPIFHPECKTVGLSQTDLYFVNVTLHVDLILLVNHIGWTKKCIPTLLHLLNILIDFLCCQAANLLRHQHLQPYILNIHLKSNNPRRHTFPNQLCIPTDVKRNRFLEHAAVTNKEKTEKRLSFGNNRALNPSISGHDLDSLCSPRRAQNFLSHLSEKFSELSVGSVGEVTGAKKLGTTNLSSALKTPQVMSTKGSANPKRQTTPSKISYSGSTRELVGWFVFSSFSYYDIILFSWIGVSWTKKMWQQFLKFKLYI